MKLKEKCIYYNPSNKEYYLVLSISDMVYGRYAEIANPNYMEKHIDPHTGLRFKIDDIIIYMNRYRNYDFDEKIEQFELIKELSDEEFYPMELLIHSHYNYPPIVIDVHNHMNDVTDIVKEIKHKKSEVNELKKEICNLEKKLYNILRRNI